MKKEICCYHKTKERPEQEYKSLINRLNQIGGQVREVKGMMEKGTYCTDILVQVVAVSAVLDGFGKELFASHIRSCAVDDIRDNKEETIDELAVTIQRLMC